MAESRTRPIAFRAWDKEERRMRDVRLVDFLSHQVAFDASLDPESPSWKFYVIPEHPEAPCILMQFTGLIDRHGKEIYEGDVIRNVGTLDMGYAVVFIEGGWKACRGGEETQMKNGGFWEVIGNIYEHPELVK